MGQIFELILIFCYKLPFWMLEQTFTRWSEFLDEDDPFGAFLIILIVLLTLVVGILLALGYRL
jgi:uncharacterized membrane protein YphA (DoxX/SURF4 family)